MMKRKQNSHTDNGFVWISTKTTNSDSGIYVFEIACVVTDHKMKKLSPNFNAVVYQPEDIRLLAYGVPQEILSQSSDSPFNVTDIDKALYYFIRNYADQNACCLAGTHTDFIKQLLRAQFPLVYSWLGDLPVDIGMIEELCWKWEPELFAEVPRERTAPDTHTTIQKVHIDINILLWYRKYFFV